MAGWSLGTYFSPLSAAAARTRGTKEQGEAQGRDNPFEKGESQQ